MNIELCNGKYILNGDAYCFWLEQMIIPEKPKKNDEPRKPYKIRASGYCANIEDVLNSFLNKKIGTVEAETVAKLLKEVKAIRKEVRDLSNDIREQLGGVEWKREK